MLSPKRLAAFRLILHILFLTGSHGKVVRPPTNSAASVGGSSWFNCSSNGVGIQWIYSEDGSTTSQSATLLTDTNCNVINNDKANFETEKPSASECNLIISIASLQLGGYYTCHTDGGAGANASAHAMLVVVDTNTNITSNRTAEILEGEVISFGVTVTYNGPVSISTATIPPLYPSLNWTLESDSEDITSSSTEITNVTSSSHIIVTATVPTVPSYVCTLFFNPPSGPPPSCDRGAPSFTFNWTSSQINTSYMSRPYVSSEPHFDLKDGCEAKILQCQPNAYPSPTVKWIDMRTMETFSSQAITAELNGTYECTTRNTIRGVEKSESSKVFVSSDGFTRMPCKFVANESIEIVMADGIPCDNVTCICKCCSEIILTCNVDALPQATYKWFYSDGKEHEGATANVTEDGNYTCNAYNAVNDRQSNALKSVVVSGLYDRTSIGHMNALPDRSPMENQAASVGYEELHNRNQQSAGFYEELCKDSERREQR